MLICMLIMVPIFLLFTKIIRGIFATIILLGILTVIAVIFGLASKWTFNQNITFDLRAWGEMVIGMFSYYLSVYVSKKNYGNGMNIFFKILEIIGYVVPIILGIIPISKNTQPYCMAVTVVCVFCGVFITFAKKGNFIKNEKLNNVFGYLGSISLPIYLFHSIIIILIDYVYLKCPKYAKYLIVFFSTLILACAYRIIADFLNKKIKDVKKIKKRKKKMKKTL